MQLVFATNNKKKIEEVQKYLPSDVELLKLSDVDFNEEIPEDFDALEDNALQKVKTVYSKTGNNCFADDTGLEVEALGGEPGVFSARYAGKEADAEKNIDLLLENLKAETNRNARFRTVFALILDGDEYLFEGIVNGKISHERMGDGGFGYDPVFIPEGEERSFAQMSLDEKNRISHRGKALRKMGEFLEKIS
jgi:XTP/dITP diphosphohydrolase